VGVLAAVLDRDPVDTYAEGMEEPLASRMTSICRDLDATLLLVDASLTVRGGHAAHPLDQTRGDPAGQAYSSLLPPPVAAEHVSLLRGVLADGQTTVLLGMIGGMLTRTTFRRLDGEAARERGLLSCVTIAGVNEFSPGIQPGVRIETSVPAGVRAVRAAFDDVGPLEGLTERELEVLRLIGLGRTAQEISIALHRSVKTIDGHRMSLGAKLGVSSKIDLARIAMSSGLTVLRAEDMPQLARHARLAREARGLAL
jgi:DNA-binding CsgD family transcriptional regulator